MDRGSKDTKTGREKGLDKKKYPNRGKERREEAKDEDDPLTFLHARSTTVHGTHGVQAGSQLGVLLLNLQLGAGGLGIGDGVDDLSLGASQLSSALEVLESL